MNANESTGSLRPGPTAEGPGSPTRRRAFLLTWGAVVFLAAIVFRTVVVAFVLAIVIAYVLSPVVMLLEKVRFRDRTMPRWVAVLCVYAVLLAGMGVFTAVGVPRLVVEVQKMTRDVPALVQSVREDWIPRLQTLIRETMEPLEQEAGLDEVAADVPGQPVGSEAVERDRIIVRQLDAVEGDGLAVEFPEEGLHIRPDGDGFRVGVPRSEDEGARSLDKTITDSLWGVFENTGTYAATAIQTVQGLIATVVRGVFSFFLMLMVSAYLVVSSDRIFDFFRSLIRPSRREFFDGLVHRIDRGLSGVVRGQILIALTNGVLSGIGFWALDLQYWPLLTLVATVLSIIPIFGAIISTIPAVVVGLQVDAKTALFVLIWIILIHQIEANLLNPKIMGDAAKVHPVLVIFALLAGEHVAGIVGALLAVPILSIMQSLFLHFREVALGVPKNAVTSLAPPPTPREFDESPS